MRKFNHGHKKGSGAQLLSAPMPLTLSGTDIYTTTDNENFSAGGSTPTQVNHIVWQGLPGVYLAATNNGLMKTVDGGQTWDYLRPNATFGGDWPAGSVGRQVAFAVGPRACPTTGYQMYGVGHTYDDVTFRQITQVISRPNGTWAVVGEVEVGEFGSSGLSPVSTVDGEIAFFDYNLVFFISFDHGVTIEAKEMILDGVPGHLISSQVGHMHRDPVGNYWISLNTILTGPLVYKSTDKGDSWQGLSLIGVGSSGNNDLQVHAENPNIAAMTTFVDYTDNNVHVHITIDSGETWSDVIVGTATGSSFIVARLVWLEDILVCIFLNDSNGIVKATHSSDFGATWSSPITVTTGPVRYGMLVASETRVWYIPSTGIEGGIFFSDDNGQTWSTISCPTEITGETLGGISASYSRVSDELALVIDSNAGDNADELWFLSDSSTVTTGLEQWIQDSNFPTFSNACWGITIPDGMSEHIA